MPGRKKTDRVSLELDKDLARGVAAEMARMKKAEPRVTRAAAIKAVLARQFRCTASSRRDKDEVAKEILRESGVLKEEGAVLMAKGRLADARRVLLAATIKELEALWVMDDPSEETLKSSLIEVVGMLKDATGYRHLPDVPRPKRSFAEPAV